MHSPAGRICSKFRASLKPDSLERLLLSYFLFRRGIETDVSQRGAAVVATEQEAEELALEIEHAHADDDGADEAAGIAAGMGPGAAGGAAQRAVIDMSN
jgi:hypothetical protein